MSFTKKTERKPENLKKLQLIELNEIQEREEKLLKNRNLINKLPDEGESIATFLNQVKREIEYRNSVDLIQDSFNKMSFTDHEKHVRKLCQLEKSPQKEKFKPFASLNKVQEVPPDSKIFEIMEDCNKSNKPTKLILLPESMDILKKQEERVKEEQIRVRFNRLLQQEDNEEESEGSDLEQPLDDECT